MYGNYQHQVSQYKRQEIQTASPGKLIVMLYDGAIKSVEQATEACHQGNYEQKEKALSKAQDIVLELLGALDIERGGDIARNLQGLYIYIIKRINAGHLTKDLQALEEARRILTDLREAWEEIRRTQEPVRQFSQTG